MGRKSWTGAASKRTASGLTEPRPSGSGICALLFKSPLRQIKKLQRKILHSCPEFLDGASKPVKKNRGRNSRRKPQRGGDQRFRNARRNGAQAGATRGSKALKSVDDPPNRAEQANKWRDGRGGRKHYHVAFQACDFLAHAQLQTPLQSCFVGERAAPFDLSLDFGI